MAWARRLGGVLGVVAVVGCQDGAAAAEGGETGDTGVEDSGDGAIGDPTDTGPSADDGDSGESGEPTEVCAVRMLYDPDAGRLHAFPDDEFSRLRDDGLGRQLDFSELELDEIEAGFASVFASGERVDGYGTSSAAFVRFDGALDEGSIEAGIILLELGDEARRIEVAWSVVSDDDDGETVVLEPMLPLRPERRHAIVVTDALRTTDGGCVDGSEPMKERLADGSQGALGGAYAELEAALPLLSLTTSELTGVVAFRTGDPTSADRSIAAAIDEGPIPEYTHDYCSAIGSVYQCNGWLRVDDFTAEDGVVADDGAPQQQYELPVVVYSPTSDIDPGRPTLWYGHGLGGTRETAYYVSEVFPSHNVIAVDAPKHGEHPDAAEGIDALEFFGLFLGTDDPLDPLVGRDNARQATYDKLQVLRAIRAGLDVDNDGDDDLSSDVRYLGISLGGVMAPQWLALARDIEAAVLIVPGARVSTIVQDSDQFSLVVSSLLPDATPGKAARLLSIAQSLIDRGEPFVWSQHVLADRFDVGGATRPRVLVQMAVDDEIVPNSSTAALARALGIPQGGVGSEPLAGVPQVELPLSDNVEGVTAGVFAFDTIAGGVVTHTSLPLSAETVEQSAHFLELGEIVDVYD